MNVYTFVIKIDYVLGCFFSDILLKIISIYMITKQWVSTPRINMKKYLFPVFFQHFIIDRHRAFALLSDRLQKKNLLTILIFIKFDLLLHKINKNRRTQLDTNKNISNDIEQWHLLLLSIRGSLIPHNKTL